MSKPAAFKACFTDWKLIRGRKVVQVVLELPLEQADDAYQALGGMPDPGHSVWCAVARLNPETTQIPARKPPAEKRLIQQAGICCADPRFRAFLVEERFVDAGSLSEEEAASGVRSICCIKSRSEIAPGTEAATRWERIYGRYLAWREMAA
jgi:hypothetical protein